MTPTWLVRCELPQDTGRRCYRMCYRMYSDTLPRWERWALMWLDHYHGWSDDPREDFE